MFRVCRPRSCSPPAFAVGFQNPLYAVVDRQRPLQRLPAQAGNIQKTNFPRQKQRNCLLIGGIDWPPDTDRLG